MGGGRRLEREGKSKVLGTWEGRWEKGTENSWWYGGSSGRAIGGREAQCKGEKWGGGRVSKGESEGCRGGGGGARCGGGLGVVCGGERDEGAGGVGIVGGGWGVAGLEAREGRWLSVESRGCWAGGGSVDWGQGEDIAGRKLSVGMGRKGWCAVWWGGSGGRCCRKVIYDGGGRKCRWEVGGEAE
ncbi:hypothetical protein Tco_0067417 [Tanacetum coccineum]